MAWRSGYDLPMSSSHNQPAAADRPATTDPGPAARKDPDEWVTGEEPMTGPQASYLSTLAHDTGREVPERLTKAEASKLIDELQSESDRAGAAGGS